MPARFVGPYAETDAVRTLELYETAHPILDREGTRDAYRLEVDLMPMVHRNAPARHPHRSETPPNRRAIYCLHKRDAALKELSDQHGAPVSMDEINSREMEERDLRRSTASATRAPQKGNPSFTAGKIGMDGAHEHWLPRLIATANKYDAAGSKFLEGHILNHIVNGRIHAEIHHVSLRGRRHAARSGFAIPIRRCSRCRHATTSWGR